MEMDHGKLFIGGISWDTNEERLREYFQSYGEVVEAVIMKDRTTGRARGFGFVVFADPLVAERVLMDKHLIDGRMVEAKKAVPREDQQMITRTSSSMVPITRTSSSMVPITRTSSSIHGSPGPTRTKKIFVGGLASTVTESDFKKYFDQFGVITDVVVMYDHNTQRPRGFGFITFDSEDAVERVLIKSFHELNGKMVEVKRAVPKELSPGPNRSLLGGYNYNIGRVTNFLPQAFNPNSVGGYGMRMDGRLGPVLGGRSGFPAFGPSYGMGMNFEPGMNPRFGGNGNFNAGVGYGRGLNPYYNNNSNRYGSSVGYIGGNGGSGSLLSPASHSLWGNEVFNYATNSASSSGYIGSGGGNIGGNTFVNNSANWGSSPISAQGGGSGLGHPSWNGGNGNGDNRSHGLAVGGYSRNSGTRVASMLSFAGSSGSEDMAAYGDFYGGASYGDPAWRSAASELDEPGSFGYGLRNSNSEMTARNSAGYVDGYSVTDRQSNRGIAA